MLQFKKWFLNEVFLNPLYYDLKTPEGRAEYEYDKKEAEALSKKLKQRLIANTKTIREKKTIKLYSGKEAEDLNRMTLKHNGDSIVLSPAKSRSGALWFSSDLRPEGVDYAKLHGSYMIVYPLECDVIYDEVEYNTGEKTIEINKEAGSKSNNGAEGPVNIIENKTYFLPDGWVFSDDGHVLRVKDLEVKQQYIHKL